MSQSCSHFRHGLQWSHRISQRSSLLLKNSKRESLGSSSPSLRHFSGRTPLPPAPRVRPSQLLSDNNPTDALYKQRLQSLITAKTRTGSHGLRDEWEDGVGMNRGPISWTAFFLVAVAAASAVGYYQIERERRMEEHLGKIVSSEFSGDERGWSPNPTVYAPRKWLKTKAGWFPYEDPWAGKPAVGGPWSLIDLDGNLVTEKSFAGKWILLYFGFARCPDICPSEMVKVGKVMDIMKRDYPQLATKIVPLFVSVDPARDSLQALRSFAKDFHPSLVFLTGAPLQVEQMAKKYRVYVSKAEETEDGDYLVDHSIVMYFHDDNSELADIFTQSMRPKDIIEKMVAALTRPPTPPAPGP